MKQVMDWMEEPTRAFAGDETSDEVYAIATNEGCDMPTQSDWMKWGNAILTMLTQKSENKSEAFLMVKRHKCGWMAWRAINKWYSATSGQGLSNRMQKLMKPDQAKKDEDVVYKVEQWMDEIRECRAMGASEMGWDYMVEAIKMIATPTIREQVDIQNAKTESLDKKERWDTTYNTLMNWARIKMIEKSSNGNQMDVGSVLPEQNDATQK